jgi:transposase
MAQAYSDDLRCKLLESYEVGTSSLRELAQQFRVSFGYGKKIRRHQLLTGQKERPVQRRHGPESRIDSAAQEKLRGWLRQQPDLTAVELRDRLGEAGVWVCKSRIGQVLRALALRRKKNPSTPPSATPKPTASAAKNSSRPSPRSRRKD